MQKLPATLKNFNRPILATNQCLPLLARSKHCKKRTPVNRGLLPWETGTKICNEGKRKFRKVKEGQKVEQGDIKCATQQRPRRNMYEWVVEDDPKLPLGFRSILDRSVCEWRRFKRCLNYFNDPAKCDTDSFAPNCKYIHKNYPLADVKEKKAIPGRPI